MSVIRAERYTGVGVRDPLEINTDGGVDWSTGVELIVASVNRLLTTFPGERVKMPTFGSNLLRLLFSPYDKLFVEQMKIATIHAIRKWEPRIEVVGFGIVSDPDQSMFQLVIDVKFKGTEVLERLLIPVQVGQMLM